MKGFLVRNDPSLIVVTNWLAFVNWAHDGGYDESYFDVNDEKCLALQHSYLEEIAEAAVATQLDGATLDKQGSHA